MHLTLKFIGEVSPEKVARIQDELRGVRSTAVEMNFRNTGFFPNARHPRVFWAGIEASPNLAGMAAEIEQRIETLGISRESRSFRPHLTLARFQSEDGLPALHEALAQLGALEFGATRTEEFHLYQSTLKRGGAEYTRLATVRFVEPR
jgi:2'-5' RNA ligase